MAWYLLSCVVHLPRTTVVALTGIAIFSHVYDFIHSFLEGVNKLECVRVSSHTNEQKTRLFPQDPHLQTVVCAVLYFTRQFYFKDMCMVLHAE